MKKQKQPIKKLLKLVKFQNTAYILFITYILGWGKDG